LENILVIFEATEERTEGLALALGLGAVQHGANIRLRHLNPSPIANLVHQSYGRLKVDHLLWAEGIAIVLETGEQTAIREIVQKVEQFSEMRDPVSRIVLVAGGMGIRNPCAACTRSLRSPSSGCSRKTRQIQQ
jgi:hypothetical protein